MTLRRPGRSVRCRPSTRLLTGAALLAIGAATLSGCATGQRAQTANEFSVVDGASAEVGSMALRDAGISAPPSAAGYVKGAKATISMTVANNGNSADTLVSVSSPDATRASVSAPASAGSGTGSTAAGILVPANGAVVVGSGNSNAKITLSNLRFRLVPGQNVAVTINFRNAGQVTVQLPVKLVAGQTGGQTVDVAPTTHASA